MKAILVLAGGSATDDVVFETALSIAKPLGAHLEFLHVDIEVGEAAQYVPHLDFARGMALREALGRVREQGQMRSASALARFERFCDQNAVEISAGPVGSRGVTASWRCEQGQALLRIVRQARYNDLVVLGRPSSANGLPPDLAELLLVGCGRPMLLAPPQMLRSALGTTVVCWKDSAAAARAVGAATPLLCKSNRVVIVGVEEDDDQSKDNLDNLARHLAWNGIRAETKCMPAHGRTVAEQLAVAADYYDSDLLIMGGYGHARAREIVFGGCTQHFLDHAERAVLLMH